jgi:hypothetical protein
MNMLLVMTGVIIFSNVNCAKNIDSAENGHSGFFIPMLMPSYFYTSASVDTCMYIAAAIVIFYILPVTFLFAI